MMKSLLAIVLVLFISGSAFAWELILPTEATYIGDITESVTVSWKPVDGASYYEVQLRYIDRGYMVRPKQHSTTETSMEIKLPWPGSCEVYIMAVREDGDYETLSKWSGSTNEEVAIVNGQPMAWVLSGKGEGQAPAKLEMNEGIRVE